MTYLQILRLLERYAWRQPDVHSVVREFTDLNREGAQYSAVVIQDRDGERDLISGQDWITYTWHIGYVDRLWEEKMVTSYGEQGERLGSDNILTNRDDIYSQGIRVINNIISGLRNDYDLEITTPDRINTFNQRFTAECAGVYMVIAVTVPVSDCEEGGVEDMYDSLNQRFTSNGTYHFVPEGNPWNEADIEIDVHPEESLDLTFRENGSYDFRGEWRDANIYVDVDAEKPEERLEETVTENGDYSYSPQEGYVFSGVSLSVDVHPSTSLSETYVSNGTYDVSGEFTGGQVTVAVPQVSQMPIEVNISENGVTGYAPLMGYAFNFVSIYANVHPHNVFSETYTSNGTYNISGEFAGGQVTVAVSGGGEKPEESLAETITSNGSYSYSPRPGYVYDGVSLSVDVHPSTSLSETYTSNGTYNISGEFNGGEVTVAVSSQKPEESLIVNITSNGSYNYSPQTGYVFSSAEVTVSVPQIPDSNVIYYTSSDNNIIVPEYNTGETDITEFGANIVSNVYTNNQGVITFDGPVTIIGGIWRGHNLDKRLTSIRIPSSVTVLKGGTFSLCDKLKVLQIPPFVTKIGMRWTDGWVCNQSGLVAVEIPSNVTEIYDQSFAWCYDLVYVKLPKNLEVIGDYIFMDCTNLKNIDIPDTFTKLGAGMFQGCGLTSIRIPASVTDISLNPFAGCSYAAVIQVDSNNTVYDSRNNCNAIIETATNKLRCGFALTNIPSSVTSIDRDAFRYLTTLTSITIPSSVTSIGYYAFGECSNLTEVIVNNTIPPALDGSGDTVFSDNAPGRLIKVPASSLQDYLNAPGWSSYASSIVAQ